MVGEFNLSELLASAGQLATPTSSTLTVPSGRILMLAGLRSMDDTALVRCAECFSDLPRELERVFDREP